MLYKALGFHLWRPIFCYHMGTNTLTPKLVPFELFQPHPTALAFSLLSLWNPFLGKPSACKRIVVSLHPAFLDVS